VAASPLPCFHSPNDGGSTLEVRAYYDYLGLTVPHTLAEYLSTYDLEVQHTFTWGSRQQIVWGGGYRVQQDSFSLSPGAANQFFDPQSRTLYLDNLFVQDSIALLRSLKLILGTKVEDDPYSGVQLLPSVRLSWKVTGSKWGQMGFKPNGAITSTCSVDFSRGELWPSPR